VQVIANNLHFLRIVQKLSIININNSIYDGCHKSGYIKIGNSSIINYILIYNNIILMKNLRLFGFLMMLASSALFVNCTSDPIAGADGIAGTDGLDGLDGIDGLDSTEDCRACHSSDHLEPIKAAYASTVHATGSSWARGTSGSCAQCHSNEGFIDFQEMGFVSAAGQTPNPITCNGCHNPIAGHRSFDFDTDGNDYALRTFAPVSLIVDESVVLDATNDSDPMGASNACISCHQPRHEGPTGLEAEYTIDSGHWGPHHGPQATLVEGIEGYEFSNIGISAAGTSGHSEGSSCVACHMSEGGHTWEPSTPTSVTCTKCHDAKTEVAGFEPDMLTLAGQLATVEGWEYKYSVLRDDSLDPVLDADNKLQFLDANGDITKESSMYVIELDDNGDKITEVVIGAVHSDSPNPGFYGMGATFTSDQAGAAFNYIYLTEDKSKGVHNPDYAKALIAQSIDALQ